MQFYWSLKHVPELAALSPRDRRIVHRACYKRHGLRSKRTVVALLIGGLCAGLGSAAGGSLRWVFGFPPSIWYQLIGGGIGGGVGGFVFGQVVTRHLRPFYAQFIKSELSRPEA